MLQDLGASTCNRFFKMYWCGGHPSKVPSILFSIHFFLRYPHQGSSDTDVCVVFNINGSPASISLILDLCAQLQHFSLVVLSGIPFRYTIMDLNGMGICVCFSICDSPASISHILDSCLWLQHFLVCRFSHSS
jgi:hypothetical protein